ncbi:MAG: glycerate kinase, partial [Ignavibacteriaceae bacterium]|nr:glycerate kinase [Ignavibacteriaceae bacterium]
MTKRILISPNSFKECADSVTIAELIEENLSLLKDAKPIIKPISDGGDGFIQVCKFYFGGEIRKYSISTAYDESRFDCPILYMKSRGEIFIESAEILGLKRIPSSFRNPLKLSSRGLGELLLKIGEDIKLGKLIVEKVYLGIGGTATIDMGLGLMAGLGLKLLDVRGEEINVIPENFRLTESIYCDPTKFSFEIIPIIDVTNPLFGNSGGIKIFGRQKGASEEEIFYLEKSFNHIINLLNNKGLSVSSNILSGAGGGIPAVFQIFYNS